MAKKPARRTAPPAPPEEGLLHDPYAWVEQQTPIQSSRDVQVPTALIEQVIGQDHAVAVAAKCAQQRRHLLLIGEPGTGKSMIARAMAEMLPPGKLQDVLTHHNPKDPNQPLIATVEANEGPGIVKEMARRARRRRIVNRVIEWTLIVIFLGFALYALLEMDDMQVFLFAILIAIFLGMFFRGRKDATQFGVPKLLITHDPSQEQHAPYVEATGSHAGALLGDVRHDPFQSGGLETPPHERVEPGAIHRADQGVLFIDEINVLRLESQQALLSAMQERQYAIVGQSQTSSGAMVRTAPVPCDFILVAAGNLDAVQTAQQGSNVGMHPALRSRIRGYGYEVYVNSHMPDTDDNRHRLVRFVAQEIQRDGRIPHFDRYAIAEVILEAQRRSGQRGKLTLRLRELGGLVRTAGDIAASEGGQIVTAEHVRQAKRLSRSLEQQIAEVELEHRRAHSVSSASREPLVGLAYGAGMIGTGEVGEPAGLLVPLATAVSAPISRHGGHFAFGGGLDESARAETETVRALLKSLLGQAVPDQDVHVQALVAQEGVDGEGVGAAIAVSALSALERAPVRQDTLIAGSLTVTGELRPVRGITQRIESAADSGCTRAIVPAANRTDVLLSPVYRDRIEVLFAQTLEDVLEHALAGPERARVLSRISTALGRVRQGTNGHKTGDGARRVRARSH
jgi:ATP-dependent Lon protease